MASHTFAEKSPPAVAASDPDGSMRHDHTAPLWPTNVPIQSPVVPSRTMGILSWHADIKSVSCPCTDRNWSSANGRVWPGQTMGICRAALLLLLLLLLHVADGVVGVDIVEQWVLWVWGWCGWLGEWSLHGVGCDPIRNTVHTHVAPGAGNMIRPKTKGGFVIMDILCQVYRIYTPVLNLINYHRLCIIPVPVE